jgi:two-component system, cell cycle response regulator
MRQVHLKQLSVIYAEDDEFTRLLYAEMLRPLVVDLRLADNGKTALELFHERPCDMLITDLSMPEMDGAQLCQALRQELPDLAVVIVSSHDQGALLLETANLGIDGYLLKPVSTDSLVCTLLWAAERTFSRRQLEQAARYWHQTFDSIPDLITILDQNYRVVNMNRAAQQRLGVSLADALGQDYCVMLHPDHLLPDDCARRRLENGCCMNAGDEPVAMLGGYFNVTVTPICDEQGVQNGTVHVARNVTEKTEVELTLRYISTHDQLTGVYNRAWFESESTRLLRGRAWPVSVIVADLDGLKLVNDRHGHAAGDELLKRAAQSLIVSCRADEMISRTGGDEFVILLPGIDSTSASAIVTRIRNQIADEKEISPRLLLSVGAATADSPEQFEETLSLADQRMYQDKTQRKAHMA